MSDGKIFVRECPTCGRWHQTADQARLVACDDCRARRKPASPELPEEDPLPARRGGR